MQLNLFLMLSALSAVATTSPAHVRRQLEECESGVDSRAAPGIVGSTYSGTYPLPEWLHKTKELIGRLSRKPRLRRGMHLDRKRRQREQWSSLCGLVRAGSGRTGRNVQRMQRGEQGLSEA